VNDRSLAEFNIEPAREFVPKIVPSKRLIDRGDVYLLQKPNIGAQGGWL
jgi:hypothetical protein